MWKQTIRSFLTAAAFAGSLIQPAAAQGYYGPPPPPQYGYGPPPPPEPNYYRCEQQRRGNTAGGAIIGAIAGGLFGNAISGGRSRGAGTALGAVAGGLLGASVGNRLSCDDLNYASNVYVSGFEAGRPNHRYDWRAPSGAYGYLDVGNYYRGPGARRCATYTQQIYVEGRPEISRGHACRRPDGTWAILD